MEKESKKTGIGGILITIILFIFLLFFMKSCTEVIFKSDEPKSIKDATNREMRDFLEWDRKQQQKKYDNEKFFK